MNKEEANKQYWNWVEEEKKLSGEAYLNYRKKNPEIEITRNNRHTVFSSQNPVFRYSLTKIIAAAVLLITVGLSLLLSKEKTLNPESKYTEEQIALSYEHTLNILATYSGSLNKSFEKLQSLSEKLKQNDNQ